MTHGQARARTVLVRLRSMMSRVLCHPAVRRLLVVGGIAVAGWLAGAAVSGGQAHAGTAPGPATGITRTVLDTGHDKTAEQKANRGAPAATDRANVLRGIVGGVVTPERGNGFLGMPGKIGGFVTGILPATDRIGTHAPWAPRHHTNADAAGDGWAGAHAPVRLAASGAPKGVRGPHVQGGVGTVNPAPWPGLPHPASGEIAVLPSAGSASAGRAVGIPARRLEAVSRPAPVLPIPPAVHTATDEPALSPD